ncbi:class I SAM-dependent methyltransferase family protein, partial [Candidatus Woesearchaeota archaeon]|nr:class I SAM-dependent methyltransferase family protein [Candidatus Woesearchaeota archaeon]
MKQNLKYYLKNKLTNKELKLVPSSFDVVGDILIFSEFPKELAKKEK